ncbi:MAG TPA: hypothetical protein VG407_08990 [Caulobacteraceae bacterium]|jgi:cytoskeletal protein RodZ|nr:hypothetical protein [Caulobacteraceae bacterium]
MTEVHTGGENKPETESVTGEPMVVRPGRNMQGFILVGVVALAAIVAVVIMVVSANRRDADAANAAANAVAQTTAAYQSATQAQVQAADQQTAAVQAAANQVSSAASNADAAAQTAAATAASQRGAIPPTAAPGPDQQPAPNGGPQ